MHKISTNNNYSVNFLDTIVLKDEQDNINNDVYPKPTDTNPYLHWTSACLIANTASHIIRL